MRCKTHYVDHPFTKLMETTSWYGMKEVGMQLCLDWGLFGA